MASEIVSQGRAAWGRLKQGSRSWEDWKIVGAALLEGRVVAMRDARAWHPIGRAYSSALDSWLLDNRLNVPLSNRADLFTLMGMLPEVEAWRATLTETRRQRLNRPVSVLTAYRRATAIKPVPERAIQPELLVKPAAIEANSPAPGTEQIRIEVCVDSRALHQQR